MRQRIEIIEVGPRDGLQNQDVALSTADKSELISRLIKAGARRIEVASFVNPALVPNMADAEAVVAALPSRDDVTTIGLVLNSKGLERALATRVNEIGVVVVASDAFGMRNQKQTVEQSLAMAKHVLARAKAAGRPAQVTIGVAFGCLFEGEVPSTRVVMLAKELAREGPLEIALADTVGVAVPAQVKALIGSLREAIPDIPLRCHFHNTRNSGLANAFAAVESGVRRLDASVGGIGGCPFAPGATGNIATEDVVYMLERSGYETGYRLPELTALAPWLAARLHMAQLPAMVSRTVLFPAETGSSTRYAPALVLSS